MSLNSNQGLKKSHTHAKITYCKYGGISKNRLGRESSRRMETESMLCALVMTASPLYVFDLCILAFNLPKQIAV